MNIVQKKLIDSYTILVLGGRLTIEDVPEFKTIGGVEYPIRSEVELEVARKTIQSVDNSEEL